MKLPFQNMIVGMLAATVTVIILAAYLPLFKATLTPEQIQAQAALEKQRHEQKLELIERRKKCVSDLLANYPKTDGTIQSNNRDSNIERICSS